MNSQSDALRRKTAEAIRCESTRLDSGLTVLCRTMPGYSTVHAFYVTPPDQGLKRERRTLHPVPRGGFHKAGEGPAFGDSFPDFSSGRNRAQRSVPGWGAGFCLRNWRRTSSL